MRKFWTAVVVGGCALAPLAAGRAQTTYYGQNDAGTENAAIVAQRDAFYSALGGVSTEDFESLTYGARSRRSRSASPARGRRRSRATGPSRRGTTRGPSRTAGVSTCSRSPAARGASSASTSTARSRRSASSARTLATRGRTCSCATRARTGTTYTSQVPYDFNVQPLASGNLMFYGFIDTANPFTSIEFLSTSAGDYFGFDDMTIASKAQVINPPSPVPEPSTVVLVGAGVVALGAAARRRRVA